MAARSNNENESNNKRPDYISWAEYFMGAAILAAKRSKDPVTQVGACIVNEDNRIVGLGYNGMPIGCSDNEYPWGKNDEEIELQNKHLYVCHAEINAILLYSADVRNGTIYVTLFPCNECAKSIIQSGIKKVIYLSDKHAHKKSTQAAKRMFDTTGIKYEKFTSKNNKIEIDFNDIN